MIKTYGNIAPRRSKAHRGLNRVQSAFFAQGSHQDVITALLQHLPPKVVVAHGGD